MQYIVLDLEWNQPLNRQNRAYREFGDRLIFEMIQIGAVKLDEQLNIVDSISIPIHPTAYQKIHPRIRRMTGLGPDILDEAPLFKEAMEQFITWCGDDYVLLTWGCDDVSVLQQNLNFFDCHPELPPLCDIQHMFSDVYELKNRMGLKPAMDMLSIDPEEGKDFHNAVNDALYTAMVFQRMEHPEDALKYPQKPKELIHADPAGKRGQMVSSLAEALHSEMATQPKCPVCGKPVKLEANGFVPQSPDKYIGLAKCASHGTMLVRLRLRAHSSKEIWMSVSCAKATKPNIAYIHTKQLQLEQRRAAGLLPDPEKALMNADRSSVPFED